MGNRNLTIGLLFRLAPKEAVKRLLELFARKRGCTSDVARDSGIGISTIKRWMILAEQTDPKFRAKVAKMREQAADEDGGVSAAF